MKARPGGLREPKHIDRPRSLDLFTPMIAALAALLAGPALAAPSYPAALDRDSLRVWLPQAAGISPDQVVAVTASAAAAVVGRSKRPDGRTEVLLRAVSLNPTATARGGVLAWQVKLGVDCRTGEVRAGQTIGYGSQKAEGDAIPLAPEEAAWRLPRPATTFDNAWRAICEAGFEPPLGAAQPQLASLPSSAPAPAPAAATFAENATAEETPSAAPARTGRWVVQVVSSPDVADAHHTLATLQGRYSETLQTLETRVEPAQVRGRTVYRGVVAGFASSGEASEFCATLKRDGRDCLAR
jgi:hypothetical protein